MIAYDTIVAAQVLDEQQPASLLDQASLRLGVEDWGKGKQQFGTDEGDPRSLLGGKKTKGRLGPLESDLGFYCGRDTGYTHLLFHETKGMVNADQEAARLMKWLILPGLETYSYIERNGIYVHWDMVDAREKDVDRRLIEATELIITEHVNPKLAEEWLARARKTAKKGAVPKNILSNPNFLRAWLFEDKRGLMEKATRFTKETNKPSTDEKAIKAIVHPAADELRVYTGLVKYKQFFKTWRTWVTDSGRICAYFNMTGTVSGRRSCSNPNLQQVPKDKFMRQCFGAPEGKLLLEVDFAQMEVRLAAWEAEEDTLMGLFNEGKDPYVFYAASILGKSEEEVTKDERQKAKAAILGLLYGMQAKSFMEYAKDTFDVVFTIEEAEDWRNGFFKTFPGLVRWHDRQRRKGHKKGWVRSLVGRRRLLDNILSINVVNVWKAERVAINSPIQGLGGDWTLAAQIDLEGYLKEHGIHAVGDIHDSILFEMDDDDMWKTHAAHILKVMEMPPILRDKFKLNPPIRIVAEGSIGHSWGAGNEFTLDTIDDVEVAPWPSLLAA